MRRKSRYASTVTKYSYQSEGIYPLQSREVRSLVVAALVVVAAVEKEEVAPCDVEVVTIVLPVAVVSMVPSELSLPERTGDTALHAERQSRNANNRQDILFTQMPPF